MWETRLFGTDVYHIVHWFFIYSILGWIVESIYMTFCNRKFTNRGFIHGPICPIYGVGALTVYFILKPISHNYIALYFCGTLLATTLEYITAVIMQKVFGCIWWDYNDKPFNYKGILCLESTIAWGFYTLFLFLFLHKGVVFLTELYPQNVGEYLGIGFILYYATDFTISMIGALDLNEKLAKLTSIVEEMQYRLKMVNIHVTRKWVKDHLESIKLQNMPDLHIRELVEKYQRLRFHPSIFAGHFINAYQAFKVWGRKITEKDTDIIERDADSSEKDSDK